MKRILIVTVIIMATAIGAHAQCPNTGFADGCSSAPSGTPQWPNLLDTQKVTQLNVLAGSGYTNGTYTWTASGCSGSGATGTITVAGGKLAGTTSQQYTISNEGSGYTCRPTVAIPGGAGGGSGGSIIPTVYQVRPAWGVPGVDYYVGYPTGTSFSDPSTTLPSGASYSSGVVNVTGCGVTLNALDFSLHSGIYININISSSDCVTTVTNSKFQAFNVLQPIINCTGSQLGSGGSLVFTKNSYDGLAPTGGTGSGFQVNDPIQCQGTITETYNNFHNFDSKTIQVAGVSGNPNHTEKYNLFADFGYCSTPPCSHGEAEYSYSGWPNGIKVVYSYNTYIVHFTSSGNNNLTAPHAVQADDLAITGTNDDHNVVLAPGIYGTCSPSNPTNYTAAAAVYDGQQADPNGTIANVAFSQDYIDNGGTFFPWYHSGGTGMTYVNLIDTGSGGNCQGVGTIYPSVPVSMRTTGVTSSSVALAWNAATAGTNSIAGYHIYRNGSLLATQSGITYTDSTVSSGTTYYYTVAAYDTSANIGAQSGFVSATPSGSAPAVTLTPSSVTFGGTPINTVSSQPITLTNSGSANLTVSAISISGAATLAENNTCGTLPATLTPSSNCTITVTFSPIALGAVTATVSVTDNASGSPHTALITATGTNVSPTLPVLVGSLPVGAVGVLYSGSVSATGGSPPYVFTVSPKLPTGLSMNLTSGLITGTPTAVITISEAFVVTDSKGLQSTPYSTTLTVKAANTGPVVGSRIKVTASANIRATAVQNGYGRKIGAEPAGALGTVTSVSTSGVSSPPPAFVWIKVKFDSCTFTSKPACVGWMGSDNMTVQ